MYHVVQSKLSAKVGLLIVAIACVGSLCVIYSIPLNVSTQVYEYIGKGIQADQNDSKHLLVNDSQQDTSIKINNTDQDEINIETANEAHMSSMKYILQWGPTASPFDMMGEGQSAFKKYACKYTNCFVTDNKQYFPDLTQFDAVAFSGKYMPQSNSLPTKRSEKQKYIFAATESAHNYRVCDSVYDGYFNWTWTYKLDSEVRWAYVTIYDLEGNFAGPKIDMKWPQLNPINDKLKTELSSKNKVAAWFVSHCNTLSKRESFVRDLQRVAEKTYGWTVDVYGPCGKLRCPRSRADECFGALQRDYYFYLSFENSFAEDYVTEKLVNALNHNAVPVVYGAANYSRFLPPGSYLNARELGVSKLAETMDAIYKNKTAYYDFFRWRNHFKYVETIESDICNLCAALNDEDAVKRTSVYKDFRRWWNDKQWDGQDNHC